MGKLKSIPPILERSCFLFAAKIRDSILLLNFYRENTQSYESYSCMVLRRFTDRSSFLAIMAVEVASATVISVVRQELRLVETSRA